MPDHRLRSPAGHAPHLAREMAALGLVVHARSALRVAGRPRRRLAARRAGRASLGHRDEAGDLVLAARPRVRPRLLSRAARPLALVLGNGGLVFAVFSSDLTYPLVAEALALPGTRAIPLQRDAVALVVRGDRASLLAFAPVARRHHLHGSVVTSDPLTRREVALLRAGGLEPLPAITVGGVRSSLAARRELLGQVRGYGLGRSFYFVAPHDGFTITDYLLGPSSRRDASTGSRRARARRRRVPACDPGQS